MVEVIFSVEGIEIHSEYRIEVQPGANAFDAMKIAMDGHFTYTWSAQYGAFIESIEGIKNGEVVEQSTYYWFLYDDGVKSQIGISGIVIGDKKKLIEWHYEPENQAH